MDSAVVCPGSVFVQIKHARRRVRPEGPARARAPEQVSPSDGPDDALQEIIERLERRVAASLFAASDSDDLTSRIDELLEGAAYREAYEVISGALPTWGLMTELLADKPAPEDLLEAVGEENQPALVRADRLMREGMRVFTQLVNLIGQFPEEGVAILRDAIARFQNEPLWYLAEPLLPVELRSVWLAAERVNVCVVGIGALRLRPAPGWIVRELLERWIRDQTAYLRFYAGVPGVTVAEDIVPPEERVDIGRIDAAHSAREARYQGSLAAARHLDHDVFPPDGSSGPPPADASDAY